jgi:HlyD family secretion protein
VKWFARVRGPAIAGLAIVVVVAAGFMLQRGAARRRAAAAVVQTEAVATHDIAVTIEATGTVEPIDLVEVKSKASGQITRMPVQVGSVVKSGDLLAQIDPRDVQNQYDQTLAALRAAQAKVDISRAQKSRADGLYNQQVITADEHDSATLDFANAQSALVKARTDLDLAKQRRDDATVRAPIAGTILSQPVSAGQVITSATSSASGGTSLLTMADLSRIRLRSLVSESDIGSVHVGQGATVTVDAFPQRTFQGTVEKIEPQAVVQQSVTLFPVLIAIANEGGLLLPGMNGEVSMLVAERSGVLAVPVDAVRSLREIAVSATALGLNPDSVRAQVQRQIQARMRDRAAQFGMGGDSTRAGRGRGFGADTSGGRRRRGGAGGGGFGGGGFASGGARGTGGFQGGAGATGARANRAQVVFVQTATAIEPRSVRLGLTDFDYAEVLEGVSAGEEVILLGIAEAQAKRLQDQTTLRQRIGGGTPGVPGGGAGGRGAGGGGAGGGRSGGGTGRGGS